ncbi:MAG: hypothetical protein KC419_20485 [Anaerolineales bacterium]|nr:hypothetical protein [Anaerolineales bacterium]
MVGVFFRGSWGWTRPFPPPISLAVLRVQVEEVDGRIFQEPFRHAHCQLRRRDFAGVNVCRQK